MVMNAKHHFIRLEGRSQGRVVCCKPEESMELAAKTRATIIAQIIQVSILSKKFLLCFGL